MVPIPVLPEHQDANTSGEALACNLGSVSQRNRPASSFSIHTVKASSKDR